MSIQKNAFRELNTFRESLCQLVCELDSSEDFVLVQVEFPIASIWEGGVRAIVGEWLPATQLARLYRRGTILRSRKVTGSSTSGRHCRLRSWSSAKMEANAPYHLISCDPCPPWNDLQNVMVCHNPGRLHVI